MMPFRERNQNPDCSSDRFEVVRTRPQPPKEGADEPTLEGLGGTQASRASTNHPDDSGLGTS